MNKQYKSSNYNFFCHSKEDGSYLLYNTFTGAFAAVPSTLEAKIQSILKDSGNKDTDKNIKKELFSLHVNNLLIACLTACFFVVFISFF